MAPDTSSQPPPLPGSPHGSAREFVRALVAGEIGLNGDADARLIIAERTCVSIQSGLARWFGGYGAMALASRALSGVQATHPSLGGVTLSSDSLPRLIGLAPSSKAFGSAAITDGLVAMLEGLAELVARLIGDDLAINLLKQSVTTAPARGPAHRVVDAAPVAEALANEQPVAEPRDNEDVHQRESKQ
ncbi:MAG: hypothetical protein ABJE47_16905 [bacterium]